MVAAAKRCAIVLKQTFAAEGKTLQRQAGGYAHAKQFKRLRRVVKRQRTILGVLIREAKRKLQNTTDNALALNSLNIWLERAERVRAQQRQDKNKLYALHAPEVECIGKGKAESPTSSASKAVWPSPTSKACWWLQGTTGDALHALCCAVGYNLRWLLRAVVRLGLKGLLLCLFWLAYWVRFALMSADTGHDQRPQCVYEYRVYPCGSSGWILKKSISQGRLNNQLRGQGMELIDALVKASAQRLRPILMTTGAMVLGAVPLAFASGAGAESRMQIGWVIVGSMSLGTLLTVFVVPTMYTLFARKAIPGANKAEAKDVSDGSVHGRASATPVVK